MTEYVIEPGSGRLTVSGAKAAPILTILNADEFRSKNEPFINHKELSHNLGSIRYCKAELFRDHLWGTLRIPQKSESRDPQLSFIFYLTDDSLYFIEDTGDIKQWLKTMSAKMSRVESSAELLLRLFGKMIENDIIYLSHLEKKTENLEDRLIDGDSDNFFEQLTKLQRKLSELNAYYEQLTAIGDLVESCTSPALVGGTEQWGRYSMRTERLSNHTRLLQENIQRLRELYRVQQDEKQNNVMCILTVVTTFFLPLTLLTGWYGMNFVNMPELHWKFGYYIVIAVAAVIAIIELIYFKKKKF